MKREVVHRSWSGTLPAPCWAAWPAAARYGRGRPGRQETLRLRTTGLRGLRTYVTNPGKLDALNKRFRKHTNDLFKKPSVEVIGYSTPLDAAASQNTLIYLLAFPASSPKRNRGQRPPAGPGVEEGRRGIGEGQPDASNLARRGQSVPWRRRITSRSALDAESRCRHGPDQSQRPTPGRGGSAMTPFEQLPLPRHAKAHPVGLPVASCGCGKEQAGRGGWSPSIGSEKRKDGKPLMPDGAVVDSLSQVLRYGLWEAKGYRRRPREGDPGQVQGRLSARQHPLSGAAAGDPLPERREARQRGPDQARSTGPRA